MHGTLPLVNSGMCVTGGALSVSPGVSLLTMMYRSTAGRDDVILTGGYGPSGPRNDAVHDVSSSSRFIIAGVHEHRMHTPVPLFVRMRYTHTCVSIQDTYTRRATRGACGRRTCTTGNKS